MKSSQFNARNILLIVFVIATIVTVLLALEGTKVVTLTETSPGTVPPDEPKTVVQFDLEKATPLIVSLLTSVTTFLGFVVTTITNIRKESRETRALDLSLKQKEIELQRALLELDELKKKASKS